jgi:hypothetical protein
MVSPGGKTRASSIKWKAMEEEKHGPPYVVYDDGAVCEKSQELEVISKLF